MAVRNGVSENTARLFILKIRGGMKSSEAFPMDENVPIDEFVVGGKENR